VARSDGTLTSGEWAVLGLLAEQPTHGFAIAKAMAPDGAVGRIWSMRRPLVYRALDLLGERGYVRPVGSERSREGPRRTVLELTPAGRAAVEAWLREPVERIRDARSLLLLKLLFLDRAGRESDALLQAQRETFERRVTSLSDAVGAADGFDRTLVQWRLHSTRAAVEFIDTLLTRPDGVG
jgi:DNA-binding PadR family transcriptional regulator